MPKVGRVLFVSVFLLASCNDFSTQIEDDILMDYTKVAMSTKGSKIRQVILDSVNVWIEQDLLIVKPFLFNCSYDLNEVIAFSSDSTLLFTTLDQQLESKYHTDWIYDLAGVKIESKWYFYLMGVSTPVHREYYKDCLSEPYKFEELSYIGYKHRIKDAIIKNSNSTLTPNDIWFEKTFFNDHKSRGALDSSFLLKSKRKYNFKLDSEEKQKIMLQRSEIRKSPGPEKELTLKERLFGKKKKLFDSDAWKNRNKKK